MTPTTVSIYKHKCAKSRIFVPKGKIRKTINKQELRLNTDCLNEN